MRIGLREANLRFSRAIKAVKVGEEVVLTERGNPIAVIKPWPAPMPGWRPRVVKGVPVSQTIREDRDASSWCGYVSTPACWWVG